MTGQKTCWFRSARNELPPTIPRQIRGGGGVRDRSRRRPEGGGVVDMASRRWRSNRRFAVAEESVVRAAWVKPAKTTETMGHDETPPSACSRIVTRFHRMTRMARIERKAIPVTKFCEFQMFWGHVCHKTLLSCRVWGHAYQTVLICKVSGHGCHKTLLHL